MKRIYTLLAAIAVAGATNAQTTLPKAIYTLDFEGTTKPEDLNAEQVGKGLFLQSSIPSFGTYYQNNPDVEAGSHKNYLIVPTQGFHDSNEKSATDFSIGMWINAYVANKSTVSHYFSTILSAYSSTDSYKNFSWPMFSARERQTLQINCAGWSDYTNEENVNGANVENTDWNLIKMYDTEATDEEGNVIQEDKGFDDNWHYVVFTFSGLNAKFYVDGEVKNEWNATANNYCFPSAMAVLNNLYLGDCGPFWQDQDGSYAFDDINFYPAALTPEQQELIMNIKLGNIGDEERFIIAQNQIATEMEEEQRYAQEIIELGFNTLAEQLDNYISSIDLSELTTEDAINALSSEIKAKHDNIAVIVNAYKEAFNKFMYYTEFKNNTLYAGAEQFGSVLDASLNAINDATTIETINTAITAVESAKVDYLFSQPVPENGSIDVTRLIDNPWFCDEAIEPTVDESGVAAYPVENPATQKGAWENFTSENLLGSTDCTMYYTQGRTTWNSFHSSTAANGTLDIHQTITGLPTGYYIVKADMVSSSEATNNHVYATSNNITKVSKVFQGNGWDGISEGVGSWETLTTDKVRVGEDGILTLGATATTDGTAYKGWYCVTNFRLYYAGTTADLDADLADKEKDVTSAIEGITYAGNKTLVNNKFEGVKNSDNDAYTKISQLTDLIAEINTIIAKENSFNTVSSLEELRKNAEGDVKDVYSHAITEINKSIENGATANDFDSLNSLGAAYTAYAATIKATIEWGTTAATNEAKSQVSALATETEETLTEKKAALISIMKSSISEFSASESEPKDITGIIANPSFDNDSYAGWTIAKGTSGNYYAECEFFNQNFDIFQTVEGLPAGTYRVTVQGYYRDGGREEAVKNYGTIVTEEDETTHNLFTANAIIYANNVTSNMMSLGADSIVGDENIISAGWYQPHPEYEPNENVSYPDDMNSANHCFNNGKYANNQVTVYLSEAGSITFGIKKDKTIANDWTIFDNFKLFYLGQDAPTAIESVANDNAVSASAIYSISGVRSNTYNKGINIIRMSDGTVKKVIKK